MNAFGCKEEMMSNKFLGLMFVVFAFLYLSGVFDKECLPNDEFCEPAKQAVSNLLGR